MKLRPMQNGNCVKGKNWKITVGLVAILLLGSVFNAAAMAQTRVVVLPFYVEEGADAKKGGKATLDYRRMMRFINNQLVRHDFEVINPFAKDAAEREYNRVMERAREDSVLASMEMCKKYSADMAYIVWMKVKVKPVDEGLYKAQARVDGEGYDSGGRDMGAGLSKTFYVTKRDRDDAIAEVEKEVGDLVGRKLTGWRGNKGGSGVVVSDGGHGTMRAEETQTVKGGILQRSADKFENLINVRLDGATEYETTEVFGKVINTVTGVVEAKRFGSRIIPDNPQACYVNWRARIEDTDPFRLQTNMMKMIHDILDRGGEVMLNGVPYRYTAAEVDLLKGIRPGDATSREVQFVIDRERLRDKEFEERHDPYKSKGFD
ncbi:hypothetical protein [Desulfosarcina ovata]|uniref:Flagellar assembly protein T N-terminal domain-containing protein n=2 Tax=Desulfosarcina ovata TaxID=83564 RepID=A0A5K8AKE7_9BACT|nr:hypothetical protein [Desulfosarcina ovata]BBO86029.1 hypothetical protein DSCO28_65950 [Desulfosarcina ovata subsp. sediminis]BBO92966.1 hypothetical protein DSCOOX_61460 [Desulfosarcina ovata subsp. ovata]